jgi:hypothetical protein
LTVQVFGCGGPFRFRFARHLPLFPGLLQGLVQRSKGFIPPGSVGPRQCGRRCES